MPASESFISDETVDHTSHCEFSLKKYHLPHTFEVAFIDEFFPNALSQFPLTRHSLTTSPSLSPNFFLSHIIIISIIIIIIMHDYDYDYDYDMIMIMTDMIMIIKSEQKLYLKRTSVSDFTQQNISFNLWKHKYVRNMSTRWNCLLQQK